MHETFWRSAPAAVWFAAIHQASRRRDRPRLNTEVRAPRVDTAPVPIMETLKTRADFLRTRAGRQAAMPGLVLQARPSPTAIQADLRDADRLRVGFTATRKLGGAVARNRIKRRLRAAAGSVLANQGRAGHDYVLVGRSATLDRPFVLLLDDLNKALVRVHGALCNASHGKPTPDSRAVRTETGSRG